MLRENIEPLLKKYICEKPRILKVSISNGVYFQFFFLKIMNSSLYILIFVDKSMM